MKQNLVTIGIPCYNCAPYLPGLLQSLFGQSFKDWEAIAIDDHSSDGTTEILRSIRHPRICVVLGGENLGLGPRLNQIAELSGTEFVARVDADDLMHPDRLTRQMHAFRVHPELDVCATGTYTIDNNNRLLGVRRVPPLATTALEVMLRNGPSHPTTTARREWCLRYQYNGYPKRGEDLDLWIRSVGESRILQLEDPLHFIREDPAFDLAKYRRSMRDHRTVLRRHADRAGSSWVAAYLQLRLYAKEAIYGGLAIAGLAGSVSGRRNQPMDDGEKRRVEAILARIAQPTHTRLLFPLPEAPAASGDPVPLSQEA